MGKRKHESWSLGFAEKASRYGGGCAARKEEQGKSKRRSTRGQEPGRRYAGRYFCACLVFNFSPPGRPPLPRPGGPAARAFLLFFEDEQAERGKSGENRRCGGCLSSYAYLSGLHILIQGVITLRLSSAHSYHHHCRQWHRHHHHHHHQRCPFALHSHPVTGNPLADRGTPRPSNALSIRTLAPWPEANPSIRFSTLALSFTRLLLSNSLYLYHPLFYPTPQPPFYMSTNPIIGPFIKIIFFA